MDFATEIEHKHRAAYTLLYVVAKEEFRALLDIQAVATKLTTPKEAHPFSVWKSTDSEGGDPVAAVKAVKRDNAIAVFINFHRHIDDAEMIQTLKDQRETLKAKGATIIILSNILRLPPELEGDFVVVEYSLPDKEALRARFVSMAADSDRMLPSAEETNLILESALGLSISEAEDAFSLSLVETGGRFDHRIIAREKAATIKKKGILEVYPSDYTMADVGGLANLKAWLNERDGVFTDDAREFGLPMPKGVLITGIPGTGKSLISKVIANTWGVPLVRLDFGKLFAGIVGASEQNVRAVIETMETIAPAVLWIDEVEKGMAGLGSSGNTDSGVTSRVFGTLITWMQERKRPVFMVLTANKVENLPPEFLRAGRLDAVFFVDLPTPSEREDILGIHIRKVKRDTQITPELIQNTAGFSGAELENVVVKGLYRAFARKRNGEDETLTTADLLYAAANIVPLSKTREAEIEAMREWAKDKAIMASLPEEKTGVTEAGRKISF